jgi:hypothetical protein
MRHKRFSFLAGWLAVGVLAAVGFAAFGNVGRPDAEQVRLEAAAASMGHTSGAYAGIAFAEPLRVQTSTVLTARVETQSAGGATGSEADTTEDTSTPRATGTITSPETGWLSEVQVRALVSLYFKEADVNRAIRVAWCESRFDPNSVNLRTGGVGIFQHLPRYWEERTANAGFPGADPTDPAASIAAAAWEIYNGGGWDLFCRA